MVHWLSVKKICWSESTNTFSHYNMVVAMYAPTLWLLAIEMHKQCMCLQYEMKMMEWIKRQFSSKCGFFSLVNQRPRDWLWCELSETEIVVCKMFILMVHCAKEEDRDIDVYFKWNKDQIDSHRYKLIMTHIFWHNTTSNHETGTSNLNWRR